MSRPAPSSPPPPETDRLPFLRLLAVAGATLALFGATVATSAWLHTHWAREISTQPLPAVLGHTRLNELYQQPFPLEQTGKDRRAREQDRLHRYGWVDRAHGRIHIPLEQAEAALLQEAGGAPRHE